MADVSVNLAEQVRELPQESREVVFDVEDLGVAYSGNKALQDVSLEIYKNFVTAFIGPSGCSKSTFIRCFNRMNDLITTARWRARSSTTAKSLRPRRRSGRSAEADRHGLPEAQPVPEVDLRQRRLRPTRPRDDRRAR